MNMKELRFVCAQPATLYYAWQVEVLINNFIEMGVNPNYMDIVCWKSTPELPPEWTKLAETYAARFFFYEDTRNTKHYISSIRPNILKQHWAAHPYLKDQVIFYHDCDIIFTKPISTWLTPDLLEGDVWYGSDTRWYISHDYIKSKRYNILDKMCTIVDIPISLVEQNELNCIGAQYLMKNVNYFFWDEVEKNSERLFKEITDFNQTVAIPEEGKLWEEEKRIWESVNPGPFLKAKYNPLQIWCADMWAVLWEAWKLGYTTVCHPNFTFSWATSGIEEYNKTNIMHNAGASDPNGDLFYKSFFMKKLPYGRNVAVREGSASKKYYEWIQKVGKKTCLTNLT